MIGQIALQRAIREKDDAERVAVFLAATNFGRENNYTRVLMAAGAIVERARRRHDTALRAVERGESDEPADGH